MPDPTTIERLKGLILSAQDLRELTDWPGAVIEDYLNILDNLIMIANLLDVEIDTDIKSLIFSSPSSKSYDNIISDIAKAFHQQPSLKNYESRISELEKYISSGIIAPPFTYYLSQTVWDDLRFPVGSVRGGGAFDTTATAYKGGIVEAFSTGPNNESVQFVGQFPHSYKLESQIEFHVHWTIPTSGAGAGVENVKWDFTYSWANIGGSFPGESSATVTVDVQAVTADDHVFTSIVDISGAGIDDISSIIICSLTRDVGVANDYADDAYFLEADFHFEGDTIGSRLETGK